LRSSRRCRGPKHLLDDDNTFCQFTAILSFEPSSQNRTRRRAPRSHPRRCVGCVDFPPVADRVTQRCSSATLFVHSTSFGDRQGRSSRTCPAEEFPQLDTLRAARDSSSVAYQRGLRRGDDGAHRRTATSTVRSRSACLRDLLGRSRTLSRDVGHLMAGHAQTQADEHRVRPLGGRVSAGTQQAGELEPRLGATTSLGGDLHAKGCR
jgi:hypothetical protein